MRRLIIFVLVVLLGFNGLLVWQSREKKSDIQHTCCLDPGKFNIRIGDIASSVFPGATGLIQ